MFLVEPTASFSGGCTVRTGRFRVSMRFKGPEKVGVVAVSRTPRPDILGIFDCGASQSDAASPSEREV
jgi:hypothetical protein